jgi:Zn-dependent protease
MGNLDSQIFLVSAILVPAVFAITFHEAAHGYVAWRLGDDTAKAMGRVTFNPFRHIDLFGTIILPIVLRLAGAPAFGYAKPVPVNFRRLRQPRRDMVWVALAGPGTNIALALAIGLLMHMLPFVPRVALNWTVTAMEFGILINLVLAVVNMIPLPPLDGGRVAVGLLPDRLAIPLARTERYGILVLLGVLVLLPWIGDQAGVDLHVLSWIVGPIVDFLYDCVLLVTGN